MLAPRPGPVSQCPWSLSCPSLCSPVLGPGVPVQGSENVPFPAVSVCAAEQRCWGWLSSQSQNGVPRAGKGRRASPLTAGESPSAPTGLRHPALGSTREHTSLCCPICLECSYPSTRPPRLCPSITSSVKPSMTSTGGHTSAVLLEPHPLVATLSIYLVLLQPVAAWPSEGSPKAETG